MAKDFTLDEKGDISIKNGDFEVVDSTKQEIQFLMVSKKGEWKANPLVGANLEQYLKQREGLSEAIREGKIQLKQDGFRVDTFKIQADGLIIQAERP